ncbi:ABC transporter permease [Paenibacillus sp. JCM 10914]|uniref:ABC transporter permease n=1 Tax=Paenibacillus sp. JCM 10914 TaxID=1236974 RepID=UPI0003CC3BEF|nr:ABC transporter permease [Paenibacillus sp. JCM 10914]GAE08598.1 ABC-type multidrug transport system, permease component [Paenibacillus sp. JCM 10914]
MNMFWTILRIEGRLVWKGLDILIFGILFPIILAGLFGYIMSKDATLGGASMFEVSYPAVVTIGILATGVMGIPLTISDYRHRGILKRFQVTPANPLQLLLAQGVIQFTSALISFVGVTLIYILLFQYEMNGSWMAFLTAYANVLIAMYAIGIFIGSVVPDQKAANLWSSLAYFSMLLFSGATIPYEIMPSFVQRIMDLLPLAQGIHLMKHVSLGEPLQDVYIAMIVIGACIMVGIFGSVKLFRWK